jgi:hypothetical protein
LRIHLTTEKIVKICLYCNAELVRKEKEGNNVFQKRVYCGLSCASTHFNIKRRENLPSKPKFKTGSCRVCGTDFLRPLLADQKNYSQKTYCDNCREAKKIETYKSKGYSCTRVDLRTKGELFESRKNWQSARTAIRNHANIVLQTSKQEPECKVCGYAKHVEVCHIKSVSEFTDEALIGEINALNNLVYLCPNHHWEFDNNGLDIG